MKKHLKKQLTQRRKKALQRLKLMNLKRALKMFLVKILYASLILFLISCTSTQQTTITQIKTEYVKIPQELLILEPLNRPQIENESDIINAYLDLYNHYKQCKYNINAIKEINKSLK